MEKVKLGFIGCGFMGQLAHLKNYMILDDCEVVAVCDLKLKQARMVAARYGIPNAYDDARKILEDPAIDAVVAIQKFTNHVNLLPEILKAKKFLMTEKPLCVHPENGKRLAKCAADNGVKHFLAYHKRSDPATEYAKEIIGRWQATGEMGKMKYVRVTMPPGDWICGAKGAVMSGEEGVPVNAEPPYEGVDKLTHDRINWYVNYYIHQVNYMRHLLGEDYRLTFADPSRVMLAVESDSGVCGVLEMEPYKTTDDWQEKALVCFEKGWIEIELPAPLADYPGKVTVFSNNEKQGFLATPRLPNTYAMRNQAANFVRAARGEQTCLCPSSDAVKDLQFSLDYIKAVF